MNIEDFVYICPKLHFTLLYCMATVDDKKIIFSMVGVSKSFQNNKQVLKNIYLSFFYGAKIGIIGLNGSGIRVRWSFHRDIR